jgi:hypothetical protein
MTTAKYLATLSKGVRAVGGIPAALRIIAAYGLIRLCEVIFTHPCIVSMGNHQGNIQLGVVHKMTSLPTARFNPRHDFRSGKPMQQCRPGMDMSVWTRVGSGVCRVSGCVRAGIRVCGCASAFAMLQHDAFGDVGTIFRELG